jgi:hypothetical protein
LKSLVIQHLTKITHITNPSLVIKKAESVLLDRNAIFETYSAAHLNTQVVGDPA